MFHLYLQGYPSQREVTIIVIIAPAIIPDTAAVGEKQEGIRESKIC